MSLRAVHRVIDAGDAYLEFDTIRLFSSGGKGIDQLCVIVPYANPTRCMHGNQRTDKFGFVIYRADPSRALQS